MTVETTMPGTSELGFEPPGPGGWSLDTTHHGRRPITRFLQPMYRQVFEDGLAHLTARYGLPLAGMKAEFVHGCMYYRGLAVGEKDTPRPAPPAPIMWLVSRLHPELRRRNRTARQAWEQRRWRDDVDTWFHDRRPVAVDGNLALQRTDLASLDDSALADHVEAAAENFVENARFSFLLHGGDLVPVGDYLAHCASWGIEPSSAAALLEGASPASRETADLLAPVARALAERSEAPGSVAEVRSMSPEADAAAERWLELHGWRLLSSDDLDAPCLAERPDLQLMALRAASPEPPGAATPDGGGVRALVPAAQRAQFDELLAEARHGLRLRDDNVGVGWNWPGGLLRRALLEVGRRLVGRGALEQPDHVLELDRAEVQAALRGERAPSATEVAERVRVREAVIAAEPPLMLGEPEEPPPLSALPAPMARAAAAVFAVIGAMEGDHGAEPMQGSGIGTATVRGRACVVSSVDDALAQLEPGDVLVAPFTGPAYNSLLPVIGGLVVEEGGPMCHAAIVAREFGIPAVVGAAGATQRISTGQRVEVDPDAGAVRVVG